MLGLTRMIHLLTIRFDLRQREPRGFELFLGIKLSLVEIVGRFRIGALAEHQQRSSLNLRPEFDDAHERRSGNSVASLLSLDWPRVKVVYNTDRARRAGDWQARSGVAEGLELAARLDALQSIHLAPRDLPGSEVAFEIGDHFFKRANSEPIVFDFLSQEPSCPLECQSE